MSPYHEGELEVQRRAGVLLNAARIGNGVHGEIPPVARAFAVEQRFVVLSAADQEGRVWGTILHGPPGFLTTPTAERLVIAARPGAGDPLAGVLERETDVGLLLIDLPTRRRMRVNGRATPFGEIGLEVTTREVYANCPKYIHPRAVETAADGEARDPVAWRGAELTGSQMALLRATDTLFLASRHPTAGADVSHRGGIRGFLDVPARDRIVIPDYSGNMMFNTLGNLTADPRAGLLVVDWASGALLQLTGRAIVNWESAAIAAFAGAQRLVEFTIDAVVERRGAGLVTRPADDTPRPAP
jgi:predicted pyridoxine 5'-phosphate oxidase superfamily flavin-nucleotide-binding protein